MEGIVNVGFETVLIFQDADKNNGAVIRQVGTDRHYLIAAGGGVQIRPAGSVFNVEFTKHGMKTLPPKALKFNWNGMHIGGSGRALEQLYLAAIYALLGSKDDVAKGDVFANKDIMLLDGAYKYIHGTTAKQKLAPTNYYYPRRKVITGIVGDSDEVKYTTPRTLYYYPLEKTVVATFMLESPLVFPEMALPEEAAAKFRGSIIQIQRAYQGVAWKSLRNLMRDEPAVDKMVRGAIADGFIKPTVL